MNAFNIVGPYDYARTIEPTHTICISVSHFEVRQYPNVISRLTEEVLKENSRFIETDEGLEFIFQDPKNLTLLKPFVKVEEFYPPALLAFFKIRAREDFTMEGGQACAVFKVLYTYAKSTRHLNEAEDHEDALLIYTSSGKKGAVITMFPRWHKGAMIGECGDTVQYMRDNLPKVFGFPIKVHIEPRHILGGW